MQQVERTEGCNVLYTDTDSVVFSSPIGVNPIAEGEFLGEMSREYANFRIERFAAAGPKQWGMEMINRKTGEKKWVLKLRGITLDYGKKITFFILKIQFIF
jgi:hypothetical protein